MKDTWTFGRKLGAGLAAALMAVLVVAFFGYQSTERLIDDNRWVSHTHEVRTELAQLLGALIDAETSCRGFVITGDEHFLEQHTAALVSIPKTLDEIGTLTADNPRQQRAVAALRPVIDAKLAHLATVTEARKREGLDAAVGAVASGHGKKLMDELRHKVRDMDEEEQRLLLKRASEAEAASDETQAVIVWGSILGSVLVALIGWFIARTLTQQISAAVHYVQSSSAELQAASSQQASGAKQQTTAMNEITTTINELLATSRQIAESARHVSLIAAQTVEVVRVGDATVANGNSSVMDVRQQVDLIVSHMLELGKKSQQIGSVLDIVSELAEQTNILAINATIEAVGAGQAGARFSVVADEIRKLADRVAGSTNEIRALIDDVRSAVNTAVMTTESGSKAVDAGGRQFHEIANAFMHIASHITTATEAAKEIELSTKQQASAVEQVNLAITNVAQASKENEISTGQTLRTASDLSVMSQNLLKLVQPRDADEVRDVQR